MADQVTVEMLLKAQRYINEAKKAATATDGIADAAGQTVTQQKRLGTSLSGTVKGLALVTAGALSAREAINFGRDAIDSYSALEESLNAVNVQFEAGAGTIMDFGETAAESVGLANSEFNQLSVTTGAILSQFIDDQSAVADETINLTQRAADLASVFNTDVNEALIAVQASLRGEQEPIRRFGVSMDEATVNARALTMGLADTTSEITLQDKQLARLEILYEQTAKVQGDFANTSDSVANRQKILNARFEDAKAALGEALLPAMTTFLDLAERGIPAIESFAGGITNFGDRATIAASKVRVLVQTAQDLADVALGPVINLDEVTSLTAEARLQAVASAAVNVRGALAEGTREIKAYAAGLGEVFLESEMSRLALEQYQQALGLTDTELLNAINSLVAHGDALGYSAEQLDFLVGLSEKYQGTVDGEATQVDTLVAAHGKSAEAMEAEALAAANAQKELRDLFGATDKAITSALANEEAQRKLANSYAAQAAATRDATRAQAEAASPILALLNAQERVRAAQEKLSEVQQDGEATSDDLRDAQLDLVSAQGDLEVAAANATENINEGTSSFADLARQAGLTEDDIWDLIAALDDIPTQVPININFTVTGLNNLPTGIGDDIDGILDVPFLAEGGPLAAGELAVVGERGPELFRPNTAGQVIPLNGGMTSNASTVNVNVTNPQTENLETDVQTALILSGITEEIEWSGSTSLR